MSGNVSRGYPPTNPNAKYGGNPTPPITTIPRGGRPTNTIPHESGQGVGSNQYFGILPPQGEIHLGMILMGKDNIHGMVHSQETIILLGVHLCKG